MEGEAGSGEREVFAPCSSEAQADLHKAMPGYFLLIAQKA